ncbi:MAG: toprim domain-containing protein [Muribaculaceae bacterium]|nr:toprim domain-containing protein [Muribaculaceae bacterium]
MIESEVKAMDIVIFLQNLGYNPIKINSRYAMFHVPYRNSNHPTLRINRIENTWLDYSTGRKGNIIELGKLVYQIDNDDEVIRILQDSNLPFSLQSRYLIDNEGNPTMISKIRVQELSNKKLLSYLDSRDIDLALAVKYCREIYYSVKWKKYFALAFRNNSGGFEIISPHIKGFIAPRDLTLISLSSSNPYCIVFDNFMDFLSYLTLNKRIDFTIFSDTVDYLILNSVLNVHRSIPILKKYELVACCLSNDEKGEEAVNLIASEHDGVHDLSSVYEGYKDLNDFIRDKPLMIS